MSGYRGFRITEVVAIVAIGDDDEEGIPAWIGPMGPMPLIAADAKRLDQIKMMAQAISDQTGQNFEIVKFSVREKIGEIISSRKPS